MAVAVFAASVATGEDKVVIYELEGKDEAAVKRVMAQLQASRGGGSELFKDVAAFTEKLKEGATYDWIKKGEAPKCKTCLGLGHVSAIGKNATGKEPCAGCGGTGRLAVETTTYRVVWTKAVAEAAGSLDATTPAAPAPAEGDAAAGNDPRQMLRDDEGNYQTPELPEPYSALKVGKIKLRARLLSSGSSNERFDGWWGWARLMDHLRKVEMAVTNVSAQPTKVTVEFFWIGDTYGKSGGAYAYGLGSKDFDLGPGLQSSFTAETVARSSRWNTVYGRGASGQFVQGYVVRTVEVVDGKRRITGYHVSMPHLLKYVNANPYDIKQGPNGPDGPSMQQ